MLSWGKRNCSFFRRKETRKVSPCTRLHQVALALAATESVLRNLSLPALAASAVPVLELLSAVRSDVVACMPRPSLGSLSQSSASPGAPDSAHGGAWAGRSRDAARLAERRLAENQPWARAPERARPGQGGWAQPLDFHTQAPPIRGQPDGVDPSSEKKKRMHKARRPESPRCREAEAVLSLLRLLTFDLKLAVLAGPCASAK
ncbi:interferon lambda-4-like [Sarcophilus harrisii]|uniref:interferon lambda-4-like n=1 Tax=Sarcophilus harrisii TaxID=9305 RepID=UPI0013020B77|nr:interferon lambda-4-like [Sarcophilus harrisii]